MVNWSYFPKTDPLPIQLESSISIFNNHLVEIDSSQNDTNALRLSSDKVLSVVANDFMQAGFDVETGKKKEQKVRVPVLFGHQGSVAQAFEVDGYNNEHKIVLEIEQLS